MDTAKDPIGYFYQLAGYKREDGTYINYVNCLSFDKPNVPEESIKNLTPLYSMEQLNDLPSSTPK